MQATGKNKEFREYLSRLGPQQVPRELREGAPSPPEWPYSQDNWELFAEAAREHLRLKPWFNFAHAVALLRYHVDELGSGRLHPGARVNAATGAVVRPPQPTISPAAEDRARRALRALDASNVQIDTILRYNLEQAAYGRYTSHPRGAEAAIEAAESSVRHHDAQRESAAKEKAEHPWFVIHFEFRGPGGRTFSVGRQRVDPGLVDELRDWKERVLAQAAQHDWEYPSGFDAGNWPPFTIEGPND